MPLGKKAFLENIYRSKKKKGGGGGGVPCEMHLKITMQPNKECSKLLVLLLVTI